MQHSACVQHNTELYSKPVKRSELSLNRPPIGQYAAHYMVVSAVNLLLFFLSLHLLSHAPLCLGSLLFRQASGWAVQQSSIQAHILLTPKSNVLCLESAAGSPESQPAFPTCHTIDKHTAGLNKAKDYRWENEEEMGRGMMEQSRGCEQTFQPGSHTNQYQRYWK